MVIIWLAEEIASSYVIGTYKSEQLYSQLHSVIVKSNICFSLKKIVYNSAKTNLVTVEPYTGDQVYQMKVNRLTADPSTLNIWITTLKNNLLGFATFPFAKEPKATYGVVVDYQTTHPSLGFNSSYGLGRTAVHEVGHCFGLFHTFDDPNALLPPIYWTNDNDEHQDRVGDGVKDTPPQNTPTYGNTLTNSTDADIAFVNTMNYTYDVCSLGFTFEQVKRMHYFLQHDVTFYVTDMITHPTLFNDVPETVTLIDLATITPNNTISDEIINDEIIQDTTLSKEEKLNADDWKIATIVLICIIVVLIVTLIYISLLLKKKR